MGDKKNQEKMFAMKTLEAPLFCSQHSGSEWTSQTELL